MRGSLPLLILLAGGAGAAWKTASVADCSFQSAPDEFTSRQSRIRAEVFNRAAKFARVRSAEAVPSTEIPRRNFVDDEIFGKLANVGVPPADLSTDAEFLRRVHLDLTGRLPSPATIREFLANGNPGKRDEVIDRLLYSPEFTERWTMWFGDWLQNTQTSSNVNRQVDGRNAFHNWIRKSIAEGRSVRDMAWECVAFSGNSFSESVGAVNFAVAATTPMGPIQDMFDSMLYRTASTFLGLGSYDCVLCHDGRGHLDQLSLWGRQTTRMDAQRMAAFFSRMRFSRTPDVPNSYNVQDQATGQYDLNTTFGNRPNRLPVGSMRNLTPEYRETRAAPKSGSWRAAFADNMITDPMFARNIANRLWKHMFNLALVEPVDGMDPARLDPGSPPPEPWELQSTHPQLLERLAAHMASLDYNLREFLRLLASSSAYQLSSRYAGEWKLDYVQLFARHYPRRLEGEEIHDAVTQATGVGASYTIQNYDTVTSAIRLPEPVEPRSDRGAANFMNVFLRGNRDTQTRSQAGSLLQQLALMNDPFVNNRIRMTASPALQALAAMADEEAIDELYLSFLSRPPDEAERARALATLQAARTPAARNAAFEDLAWVSINRLEFIFSH